MDGPKANMAAIAERTMDEEIMVPSRVENNSNVNNASLSNAGSMSTKLK
jgi:hypothetical protein